MIYTAVCCSCAAAPAILAGYIAWPYAAGCCTCDAALAKTAMCFALQYAAVRSACAAAPDSLARYVALIYAAACADACCVCQRKISCDLVGRRNVGTTRCSVFQSLVPSKPAQRSNAYTARKRVYTARKRVHQRIAYHCS